MLFRPAKGMRFLSSPLAQAQIISRLSLDRTSTTFGKNFLGVNTFEETVDRRMMYQPNGRS